MTRQFNSTRDLQIAELACLGQRECQLCRNMEAGREYRSRIHRESTWKLAGIDFECLYGKPWGYVPQALGSPPPPPPFLAARQAACRACQDSDCPLRALPCGDRGKHMTDPAWYCPHGGWQHLKAAMIEYLTTGHWPAA